MKSAELIVKTLERYGVRYVFGLPGDTTHFFRALKGSSIKFVLMRDEKSAGFAADVYARLSGKPGVVYISRGPGGTNATTGIASSFMDGSPVLFIADQVSRANYFPRTHMCIELEKVFAPIAKGVDVIWKAKDIPQKISNAWAEIQQPIKGPWCLIFPEDVLNEETKEIFLKPSVKSLKKDSQKAVTRFSHYLKNSKHPMLVLGPGVLESASAGELEMFINHFQIPFYTTRLVKGVIDEKHHLNYRTLYGLFQREIRDEVFKEVDLVITIGYDYVDHVKPEHWNVLGGKKKNLNITHFTGEKPSWFSPTEEHVVDITHFLMESVRILPKPKISYSLSYSSKQAKDGRKKRFKSELGGHLLFNILDKECLGSVLRPQDILISDTGYHKLYVESVYESSVPDTVLGIGLSSIGFSVPGSIGAKLARPRANIVVVCGDGGFIMSMSELDTIRRLKLPIKIIVIADEAYGLIEKRQREQFDGTLGVYATNPDFRYIAKSFGFQYLSITSAKDTKKIHAVVKSKLPSIIVVYQKYKFK